MRFLRFAGLTILAACTTAPPARPSPAADPRWAALARALPGEMAAHHVPSVSIARIEHGALVYAGAFGDQAPGVPATPATLYNIASMTKPITAEIVLRLATKGEVSLDGSMADAWVDPDLAGDPRHRLLTPRLALSHRTGFPNWRRQTGGTLAFVHDPGTVGYSGEGYQYAARFVEHRTGRSLPELAQALVFGPSGMTETAYTEQPWFAGRVAPPTDASGKPDAPYFAPTANAADLIYTTPRDYARFLIAVLHHDGLSPAIAAERARVQVSTHDRDCPPAATARCPQASGFGLGWQVFELGGQTLLMHTGKDSGVSTFGYANLSDGSATVIFTNSDNGMAIVLPVLRQIGADPAFVAYLEVSD